MRYLVFTLALLFGSLCFAQEDPEDLCKEAGDYWSADLEQCFIVGDMETEEFLLLQSIRAKEQEKAQRLQEQQDYNVPDQAARLAALDALIARFVALRDAASDDDIIATYQAEIDKFTALRKYHFEFDVSQHGAIISELSGWIGKHKEELDALLTQ